LLKKIAHIFTLALPLAIVACGGTNSASEATPAPAQVTVAAKSCTGSYVGTIDKPSPEAVKAMRDESLRRRGINPEDPNPTDRIQAVRNLEDTSGQDGIWMEGNFAFETDANCKVVKGGTNIFYTYPYAIEGTVNADRSFDIVWTGSGSTGQFIGQINPDGMISGQLKHPAPDDFIYGLVNGTFTPNGKI
jgi:hypothetical protein